MKRYAIGIDYGTLSGRAVLVDVETGEELAESVCEYPHGVMDTMLNGKIPLEPDFALQHPQDYLDVLLHIVPRVVQQAGVSPDEIVGIGTDFTASTIFPVRADGTPLCFLPEYENNPHAYVKLWKHHAAQKQADRINQLARERGEKWLDRYGGKISSEWEFPKILQVLEEAPEIYDDADCFVEASDWIVWQLTGKLTKNSCVAGYKGIWHKIEGYPSEDFFAALHPKMRTVIKDKMPTPVSPIGSCAGELEEKMAARLGLIPGIPVAVGIVDAHVCAPAVKIDGPGTMFLIMGTSSCHMVLGETEESVPGICGVVEDGMLPGYFGYEAGQCCCGDHFAWFIDNCLPASYYEEAVREGKNIHKYLREKAEKLYPGESGLVALDWWNGNRSVLVDSDLTGVIVGMTLLTKPEEIYRALIEATAYGTRLIIETFRNAGIAVEQLIAAGGIPQKDPMTMQIYSDVLNMPVYIAGSANGPALGAAIYGALAAGGARGGYDSIKEAAQHMGKLKDTVYTPDAARAAVYDELYAEYKMLHDYFGRGENDVMKRLKAIKTRSRS
ncbi:MAG: ribulokinase [Clostridiales bacterium]|nr:ribulokinase [Clostridiales bacterium]